MSKYTTEICPYCEKRQATDADDAAYSVRLATAHDNQDDPELRAWETTLCWNNLYADCRAADDPEAHLIQVLEERDMLRAALEAVEWLGMQDECAWCGGFGKHALKCQRQIALGVV